jgi:hypothetical protein
LVESVLGIGCNQGLSKENHKILRCEGSEGRDPEKKHHQKCRENVVRGLRKNAQNEEKQVV